jgi:hypothetical protein
VLSQLRKDLGQVGDQISGLSRLYDDVVDYASMMHPIGSPKTRHMHCWNVSPAFLRPKGIIL